MAKKASTKGETKAKAEVHEAAPAALGWNVLTYAPPGPVQLTERQRADLLRLIESCEARIHALEAAVSDYQRRFQQEHGL